MHTVSKWYRKFKLRVDSKDLPPFLHANPNICMNIQRYANENLDALSIEMLSEYNMTRSYQHWSIRHSMKLLRKKAEQQSVSVALDLDSEEYKSKLKQILITHGLTCISPPSTVYRWTTGLGFRYAPRKKG